MFRRRNKVSDRVIPKHTVSAALVSAVPVRPESPGLNIQQLDNNPQQDHIEVVKPAPRADAAPNVQVPSVEVPQSSQAAAAPSEIRLSPTNPLGVPGDAAQPIQPQQQPNAFIKIAEAFLGGGRQGGTADSSSNIAKGM